MSTAYMPIWTTPRRVALIAPAGRVDPTIHEATLARLTTLGITAVDGRWSHAQHRYMAGDITTRLADFHAAFTQDDIDAVWCLRGGYGCAQLIPHLDWGMLRHVHPQRALIGYSDITALLHLFARHGRPAVHAPVATDVARLSWPAPPDTPATTALRSIDNALTSPQGHLHAQHIAGPAHDVSGILLGGNLTTLASLCGTAAALTLDTPTLLMLEDINEPDYCLERCFYQLLHTLDIRLLRGVCLGSFTRNGRSVRKCHSMFAEWLRPLGIPLYSDLPFGHQADNQAWPCGVPATLSNKGLFWQRVSHIH